MVTPMEPERIAELRRVAEEATPGPWAVHWFPVDTVTGEGGDFIVEHGDFNGHAEGSICYGDFDGDFIATFDPATVLALLDEVERLRAALEAAESIVIRAHEHKDAACIAEDRAEKAEAQRDRALAERGRLWDEIAGVAGGDGHTVQYSFALVMRCDSSGQTDIHHERDAARAEVERLKDSLRVEIDSLQDEAEGWPAREPDDLDELLEIDPNDTEYRITARAVQYRHQRNWAIARAEMVEAELKVAQDSAITLNRELDVAMKHGQVLSDAIDRVRGLHRAAPEQGQGFNDKGDYVYVEAPCQMCGTWDEYAVPMPCATIRALDGEAS